MDQDTDWPPVPPVEELTRRLASAASKLPDETSDEAWACRHAMRVIHHLNDQCRIWSNHYDLVKAGESEADERAQKLQSAVDSFLAPIYAEVGARVQSGGTIPLADLLSGHGVNVTCADLHKLYEETYPPNISDSDPSGPGIVSIDEFVRIITSGVPQGDDLSTAPADKNSEGE